MALVEEEDLTSLVLVQADRSVLLYKLLVKSHDGGSCIPLLVRAGADFSEECTVFDLLWKVLETSGGDKKSKQKLIIDIRSLLHLWHLFVFIHYMLWVRPKSTNIWNNFCSNPVHYLSAIWNWRWMTWLVPKWICNAYLAYFCYTKDKAHNNGSLQPHTVPSETNCAAACMQHTTGLGPEILICTQLHRGNFALINYFLYFYCLWRRYNCLLYFMYLVNSKLLVVFQCLQDPGSQQ